MKIYSTYKVKIKNCNRIFKDTAAIYRKAVDYLLKVIDDNWDIISSENTVRRLSAVERLIHATEDNPNPKYDFDQKFYKLPSYMRRGAINNAVGMISSYRTTLEKWEADPNGKKPAMPHAGNACPCMYRTEMYRKTGRYQARLKVFIRNTWDWIYVDLKKSDIKYIEKHCNDRKECSPSLRKRGKQWFLDFPFEEQAELTDKSDTILAVELGINTSATVTAMQADGTILGRHFLKLPKEIDSLKHSLNRLKKAQQNGNRNTPHLWADVKNESRIIAQKTATYIMEKAELYHADVIVFAYINKKRRGSGTTKELFRMWRASEVQSIVAHRAHRHGMRVSFVSAVNKIALAFDGSGSAVRDRYKKTGTCTFRSGKIYSYNLNACYNIGARYYVRNILKSLPERERLLVEAKVPQCSKGSTCTLSTLISLNAVLASA